MTRRMWLASAALGALLPWMRTSIEDRFFNSNGVQLRFIEGGSGDALVLLHGNGSSIELAWVDTGVIDALPKRYRIVALDCRGFGKSAKPTDPAAYGSNMGDDVVRLLDHLDIGRAHIIGYGMGARIASWLVVNRPARLMSATLAVSTYYVDTLQQRQSFEASAKRAEAGSQAETVRSVSAAVYRGFPGLFITEAAMSATRVPVLHIIGSLDVVRLPASRRLKEILPSAEVVIVEGATATGPQALSRRREFRDAIDTFLARLR